MKLFVAGLPDNMDDTDLREMFELYGTVTSAQVIMDRASGNSKCFGFVEYAKASQALEVMELLKGKTIFGKILTIQPAEKRV